ncbi:MAG: DUF6624 domain-containing protein [Pyrinomonadaceae bacterium]
MMASADFHPTLREEILQMRAEDERVRAQLAADGSLYEGYHPRMMEVHRRNAARLEQIINQHGWAGATLVGSDGAEAAWLIVQHAIAHPALQRRCAQLLEKAVADGEAPAWQFAYLADRISVLEGRPQVYGLVFDWDEGGEMSPCAIEDREQVDERRRSVGLPPLAESVRRQRAGAAESNERAPRDWHARQLEMKAWARSVGWRK